MKVQQKHKPLEFINLSHELLVNILSHLPLRDQLSVAITNRDLCKRLTPEVIRNIKKEIRNIEKEFERRLEQAVEPRDKGQLLKWFYHQLVYINSSFGAAIKANSLATNTTNINLQKAFKSVIPKILEICLSHPNREHAAGIDIFRPIYTELTKFSESAKELGRLLKERFKSENIPLIGADCILSPNGIIPKDPSSKEAINQLIDEAIQGLKDVTPTRYHSFNTVSFSSLLTTLSMFGLLESAQEKLIAIVYERSTTDLSTFHLLSLLAARFNKPEIIKDYLNKKPLFLEENLNDIRARFLYVFSEIGVLDAKTAKELIELIPIDSNFKQILLGIVNSIPTTTTLSRFSSELVDLIFCVPSKRFYAFYALADALAESKLLDESTAERLIKFTPECRENAAQVAQILIKCELPGAASLYLDWLKQLIQSESCFDSSAFVDDVFNRNSDDRTSLNMEFLKKLLGLLQTMGADVHFPYRFENQLNSLNLLNTSLAENQPLEPVVDELLSEPQAPLLLFNIAQALANNGQLAPFADKLIDLACENISTLPTFLLLFAKANLLEEVLDKVSRRITRRGRGIFRFHQTYLRRYVDGRPLINQLIFSLIELGRYTDAKALLIELDFYTARKLQQVIRQHQSQKLEASHSKSDEKDSTSAAAAAVKA